jgi:hypothetical protein
MRDFGHDNWSVGQGLNPGPAEYEARVLSSQLQHSGFVTLQSQGGKVLN